MRPAAFTGADELDAVDSPHHANGRTRGSIKIGGRQAVPAVTVSVTTPLLPTSREPW